MENPFLTTGYISPEYFCDREAETNRIFAEADDSSNMTIFSLRKMGKTGLILHSMSELKRRKFRCIYFDIITTKSLSDFVAEFGKAFLNQGLTNSKKLMKQATSLFKAFSPIVSTDPLTGALSFELKLNRPDALEYDLDNICNFIKDSDEKYFIAIDEFQQIVNYPDKNAEALLRSKIQFLNNTSFIFSGSKKDMLLLMFGSYSKPFYQSTSFLELKPIDKDIYSNFIIYNFAKNNIRIDNESMDFIFEKSRGITYFIQLICHDLYNSNNKKINVDVTTRIFNKAIEERRSYYEYLVNLLTRKQFEVLKGIAKESSIDKPMGSEFLIEHRLGSASTVKVVLDYLLDKEFIYKEDGKYYLSDILMSEWMKRI
ncbi:MAG: ATP-binding protein [bacterium]